MSGAAFQFSLDGLQLTGYDDFGCEWVLEEALGWFTGGEVRSAIEARSQQSGDRRGRATRSGRVVTLRGKVRGPEVAALEAAGRRLSAVLADGGFGSLVGESGGGSLSAWVQIDETPMFDLLTDRLASWQLTVGSEDPLLYGLPSAEQASLSSAVAGAGLTYPLSYPRDYGVAPGATASSVPIANAGSASYFPSIQIDGPVTNPVVSLVETGDRLAYRGTVRAGQFLDIDCARRRVILASRSNPDSGVSARQDVSFIGAWLAIPVGGATVTWTADSADPAARLSVWFYEGAWS